MSGEARSMARYARVYAAANIVGRVGGVILIPVYANVLSLEQYGVYTVLISVIEVFSLIFGMGVSKALGRFYFDFEEGSRERDRVVSTALLGFVGIAFLIAVVAYPASLGIVRAAFGSSENATLFAVAIAAVTFTLLLELQVSYYVIRRRAWAYFLLSASKTGLLLAANIIFVILLGWGVWGVVVSMAGAFGLLTLITGAQILSRTGLAFDVRLFRGMLAFGLPLVPSAFANSAMRLTERYFLASLSGVTAAAIYGLADRLVSLLQMFIATPFSQIFFVRRFETISRGQDQEEFHSILLVFVAVMTLAGAGLSAFGAEILAVIAPPAYASAAVIIPVLAMGHILAAVNLNIELGIVFQKRTWIIATIGLASLVIAIVANFILVARMGPMGAAFAWFIVNLARLVMTVVANARWGHAAIRLSWPRAAVVLGSGAAVSLAAAHLFTAPWSAGAITIKMLMMVGLVAFIIYAPALDRTARRWLQALVHGAIIRLWPARTPS